MSDGKHVEMEILSKTDPINNDVSLLFKVISNNFDLRKYNQITSSFLRITKRSYLFPITNLCLHIMFEFRILIYAYLFNGLML